MPARFARTSNPLARSSCCKKGGALGFVKPEFGVLPDLARDFAKAGLVGGDVIQNVVGGVEIRDGENHDREQILLHSKIVTCLRF